VVSVNSEAVHRNLQRQFQFVELGVLARLGWSIPQELRRLSMLSTIVVTNNPWSRSVGGACVFGLEPDLGDPAVLSGG
jgi:hypothetical protein